VSQYALGDPEGTRQQDLLPVTVCLHRSAGNAEDSGGGGAEGQPGEDAHARVVVQGYDCRLRQAEDADGNAVVLVNVQVGNGWVVPGKGAGPQLQAVLHAQLESHGLDVQLCTHTVLAWHPPP
jgi:hypothetical protein